jgi:orotidine-5'-phosphate decarboxylase
VLVEERRSQVCLGLDPDPAALGGDVRAEPEEGYPAEHAARAVARRCEELIERAGPACVAVKPQLACFERLGAPGVAALRRTVYAAHEAGLLVVADGKRGDVPGTAAAYGQALVGETPTPWGPVPGLGADAFTVNPLLGGDALEPLLAAAEGAAAGIFVLVRTSNPGAGDLLDLPTAGVAPHGLEATGALHERIAAFVAERGERLAGGGGLSGMGAVVGATAPGFLARLRHLMPAAIFLVPGVGAQGGRVADLAPAFGRHPASVLVAASRAIASAGDPASAAESIRAEAWALRRE